MSLRIYNTLTRKKEEFVPLDPGRVTMYVCGPTVYSFAHIGNARPAVVFDVLRRLLTLRIGPVVFARNITDIDDRINASAAEEGVDISVIANRFAKVYRDDMAALNVMPPDIEPYATKTIGPMIAMMKTLIEKGHAYEAEGHVLFSVPSDKDYGALSRRDRDEMIAGARVEVAPYKRDPADFVLWKPSTPDLPGWDSPWGRGRPGWHLECSAMIRKDFGETIDIHGGGNDLIFPHHENEMAQSRCAHDGAPLARYWMHNGFLNMDSEKMSKSLGNVLLVHDMLADGLKGEVIRFALLTAHYRQPLDWTAAAVEQATNTLNGLYRALGAVWDAAQVDDLSAADDFYAALEDDLNTPKAIAVLSRLAKAANKSQDPAERSRLRAALLDAGSLLGIFTETPAIWLGEGSADDADAAEIEALLAERQTAKKARDYTTADQIRDKLAARGIAIEDTPDGTIWRRRN